MDKLAPKLVRRAIKKNRIAIIIDPIYKVITGDENSADQMTNFCNQFGKVCIELGYTVMHYRHHSEDSRGGKRLMDHASGSGVFARDPDALLDLTELVVDENLVEQQSNRAVYDVCMKWLQKYGKEDITNEDDQCSEKQMLTICGVNLKAVCEEVIKEVAEVREQVQWRTTWRIKSTLREFPRFESVNLWFDHSVHGVDHVGVLKDVIPEGAQPAWQKAIAKRKDLEVKKKECKTSIEAAYEAYGIDDEVTVYVLSEYIGIDEKTVRRHIKEHGGFYIKDSIILREEGGQKQ